MYAAYSAGTWAVVLVVSVLFGIACFFIAKSKGRNPAGYFFLGFLLGLIGLIITAVMPRVDGHQSRVPTGRSQVRASRLVPDGRLERGHLRAADGGLEFVNESDALSLIIPYNTITDVSLFDKTTLPMDFPSREQLLEGSKTVLGVGHTIEGSEYGSYFSGAGGQMRQFANHRLEPTLAPFGQKMCPYCAETVKAAAIRCKHCGSDLRTQPSGPV